MPFSRPTLTEIRQQMAADIAAEIPGVDALLPNSNLRILADALAAAVNGLYGYLDWIRRQNVPYTAEGEDLEGWAALKGITRQAPVVATGTAAFSGTNGTDLPSGTPVTRSDGVAYVTTADGTVASGIVTVPVQALVTGAIGNADVGTAMILATGISGITAVGSVASALTGGADVETDTSLRNRTNSIFAKPPQGGSFYDYENWTLAVAGVTRVWVQPGSVAGTMNVYFMMDVAESAFGGFPQGANGVAAAETRDTAATGDQLAVANYLFPLQPAHVIVYAKAPTANTVAFTINGIASASTSTKAQIAAAIQSALNFGAVPGGVADVSDIEYAIAQVPGVRGFVITTITASAGSVSPGTTGNITSNAGAIPVLGTITYT